MVSEDELHKVLKTTLQDKGEYGRIKADLQTQLMEILELKNQLADPNKPSPPTSVKLVNELIREFLVWSGYKFSEMIFSTEASLDSPSMTKEELCKELNVKESSSATQLPLLLTIVSTFRDNKTQH